MKKFEVITMSNNSLIIVHENGRMHSVAFDSVPESIQSAVDSIVQYAAEKTLWIDED